MATRPDAYPVRARTLLGVRALWVGPLVLTSVVVAAMTALYMSAVVDPVAHLRDLPVVVVNEDVGATIGSQQLNIGHQIQTGLTTTPAVSSRLKITLSDLPGARQTMDNNDAYATVVIPPNFTGSLLAVTGLPAPRATSGKPEVAILTNERSGPLGVTLATGVLDAALGIASHHIGHQLLAHVPAAGSNPAARVLLSDPIAVTTIPYRPPTSHGALGLSPFYIALLTLLCGFLVGIIVNSVVDAATGYATTEYGPRWNQRQPIPINRWQTLLIKWPIAAVLTGATTGVVLVVAVGALRLDAPDVAWLWLFMWLCSASVAVGTIVLFAVLGTPGQLVALLLFVYLGLASAGGTVPVQALPGVLRIVSPIDPLREILGGTRSILYFNARADAGLASGVVAASLGLVIWLVLGTVVVRWYDRRGLQRMPPELLAYVSAAVEAYRDDEASRSAAGDGAASAPAPVTRAAPPPNERRTDESGGG